MRLQPDLDFFSQVFGDSLIPLNLPLSEDGNDLIKTVIKLIY
jgi:lipoate-protein ligase A